MLAVAADMSAFQALATTAATSKDSALADVAAIAAAAEQLQPLLEKASALRTQREPLAVRQQGRWQAQGKQHAGCSSRFQHVHALV